MRASADTRVWIGLGVLILLALLLSLGRTTSQDTNEQEIVPVRSTYRTRPSGLKALYLTLGQLGYPTRRHHDPLDRLRGDGALVLAEPIVAVAPREWRALEGWVERGNLLLLYSDSGALFEPGHRQRTFAPVPPSTAAPVQPVPAALGAPVHVIASPYRFDGSSWSPEPGGSVARAGRRSARPAMPPLLAPRPVVPLYADRFGPVLSYSRWGKGAVILACSPWSLSNAGIASGNNLALFLNLLDTYGAGKRLPVFFDEYHQGHGAGGGPLSLLPPIARGGLAQVVAALLLLVFAVSRRFGPAPPPESFERRTRAEYLAAMTTLFRRARALELAAGKLKDEAQRELARNLGLPPSARPEEIARAAQEKRGMDGERLRQTLEEADLLSVARARQIPIDEHRVLALAVKLHDLRQECQNLH